MKIEFFHSVLCAYCFIMSDRMHRIIKQYPELEIEHRSFPLRWQQGSLEATYDSLSKEKTDVLNKWDRANRIDDKHRFNVDAIRRADFNIPTSRNAMIAIRAGELAGGSAWELFDKFQKALYVRALDISDEEVIAQLIEETTIDFENWLDFYNDPATEALELTDFQIVKNYNLSLVPALVIENKHIIEGTKRTDLAIKLIEEVAKEEGVHLVKR